jgi:two-component sensor histidine kinase
MLGDHIRQVSALDDAEVTHLVSLCSSWQVLADLSFADLLLHVRVAGSESFEVCAQLRPFTSQTLYPNDLVGSRFTEPQQPIVERAFREARVWEQTDPVLVNGVPIRMRAVPVRRNQRVIAVVTKEGSPATSRRPGRLEEVYLESSERVSDMICNGSFPFPELPPGEWPRVGDGLMLVDARGCIEWASPNALSSLRRLGVTENVHGVSLDDLGLGETPIPRALALGEVVDGELTRTQSNVRLRAMPFLQGVVATGALCFVCDVTELRQKERVIWVKDAAIRETHHRVKNNLQTIASLLRLQARRLDSDEAKGALAESVLRIGSIAMVHEILSEEPSDVVGFAEVAQRIAAMVRDGLVAPGAKIAFSVRGSAGDLQASLATPLAVTLTELLQNAVEHAFPDGRTGSIAVELDHQPDRVFMSVSDDGVGLDPRGRTGTRLGLQIVRSLVEELGGRLEVTSERGTRAEVSIPLGRADRGALEQGLEPGDLGHGRDSHEAS